MLHHALSLAGLALLLAVASTCASSAQGADAPSATQPAADETIKVGRIDHPLTIDGDLSKPEWQKVAPIRVDYVNSKKGILSEEPRMTARYLWDEHYLYIGYEFFCKNLTAQGTGVKEGPPDNQREGAEIWVTGKSVDVAEFFISFNDPNFFWEIHLNDLNQFNDVWCTVTDPLWRSHKSANNRYGIIFAPHEFIEDEGPYKLATAVKLMPKADGKPSTVNDPSDVDTGYTAEIRLPWWGIGAAKARQTLITVPATKETPVHTIPGPWKMAGETLKILAVCQDGELKERYYHSSPTKPGGGWFHHSYKDWQNFELVDDAKPGTEKK